jgi:hypothetical protein
MTHRKVSGLLARWLVAAGLTTGAGCLAYLNPVEPPCAELVEPCKALPRCCRQHVHIFLVGGCDLLNCGNLTGTREYLLSLGYHQVWHGHPYSILAFDREIRRLHQCDPDARFVIVGYGAGCHFARALACGVKSDDIQIDVLAFLDGNAKLLALHGSKPENVTRFISLQADHLLTGPCPVRDADSVTIDTPWHFGVPTHEQTLHLLALEIADAAASVPCVMAAEHDSEPESAPTPRPVVPRHSSVPDAWDFLKPMTHLPPLPAANVTAPEATATTTPTPKPTAKPVPSTSPTPASTTAAPKPPPTFIAPKPAASANTSAYAKPTVPAASTGNGITTWTSNATTPSNPGDSRVAH